MTAKERAIDATWETGAGDWTTLDRERLEQRVERAIIAAIEEEREECAKIADDMSGIKSIGGDIGDAIRARGNK